MHSCPRLVGVRYLVDGAPVAFGEVVDPDCNLRGECIQDYGVHVVLLPFDHISSSFFDHPLRYVCCDVPLVRHRGSVRGAERDPG